jgi:hypothetical protein
MPELLLAATRFGRRSKTSHFTVAQTKLAEFLKDRCELGRIRSDIKLSLEWQTIHARVAGREPITHHIFGDCVVSFRANPARSRGILFVVQPYDTAKNRSR